MASGNNCPLCHTWRATPGQCAQVQCLACNATQCHSNGTARGCCKVCYFGRLPGWSFGHCSRTCSFKGCNEPAVYAYLPGAKRDACKAHGRAVLDRQEARRAVAQARRERRY